MFEYYSDLESKLNDYGIKNYTINNDETIDVKC